MRFLALSCTTFSVLYFRTSDNNLNQQLINEIDIIGTIPQVAAQEAIVFAIITTSTISSLDDLTGLLRTCIFTCIIVML